MHDRRGDEPADQDGDKNGRAKNEADSVKGIGQRYGNYSDTGRGLHLITIVFLINTLVSSMKMSHFPGDIGPGRPHRNSLTIVLFPAPVSGQH
jgi:hypothetical protein